jgi:hypothetical protein
MAEENKQKDISQNRLLVATAALAFIFYSGATFQGLAIAGATVKFANQDAVVEFLWLIWLYYYFRVYQYYKEAGIDNYRVALNEAYVSWYGPIILKLSRHEFSMLPDDDAIKSSKIRIGFGRQGEYDHRQRAQLLSWQRLNLPSFLQPKVSRSRINLLRRRAWLNIGGLFRPKVVGPLTFHVIVYPPTDRYNLQGQSKRHVRVPAWAPLLAVLSHIQVIFMRPHFIENQGPLLIGLVPVWMKIYSHKQSLIGLW